jgi:phage major head subunit gpT-like protein
MEVGDMYKMANIVNYKMVPYTEVEAIVIKGAKHNEAQWRGAFPAFYQWLVAGSK